MRAAESGEGAGPASVLGLVLIAAGVSSLLERGHVFETISVGVWWPVLPIALGIAWIRQGVDRRGGWMALAFGLWGLVVVLTPISFAETWPLVLLVWGASTLWPGFDTDASPVTMTSNAREQHHAG